MDSNSSSQPASEGEAPQLLILPIDILIRILKFLDIDTLLSGLPLVCKLSYQLFGRYSGTQHSCAGYVGYICESLMFLREGSVIQPAPEYNYQPLFFRPNAILPREELKKPSEIRIDVFTSSASQVIHLREIVSMIIRLSIPNATSKDVHTQAFKFLNKLLSGDHFENLKNLKVSGFLTESSLSILLSTLRVDWLHWICPLLRRPIREYPTGIGEHHVARPFLGGFQYGDRSFSVVKRLHLKLEENFNLNDFPLLPFSLNELSLHLSDLGNYHFIANIYHCKNLRRM